MRRVLAGIGVAAAVWAGGADAAAASWSARTVDGDRSGPFGRVAADIGADTAAVVVDGRPLLFYYDGTRGDLRRAVLTDAGWRRATLDGAGGANGRIGADVGVSVSAAVFAGRAHVFYYDNTNRDLRHAWQTGSGWRFATLDAARDTGFGSSAVTAGGVLHAFWVRRNDGALRAGRFDGASWTIRTIDSTGVSAHQQSSGGPQDPETAAVVFRSRVRVVYAAFREIEDVGGELFEWGELRLGTLTDAGWRFTVRPGLVECCVDVHLTAAPFGDRLHVALNWIGLHRIFVFATTWRPAGWGPETSPGGTCGESESFCDDPHLARFRRSLDLFSEDMTPFAESTGLVRRVWDGAAFGPERLLQPADAEPPLFGGPSSHVRHDDALLLAFGAGDLVVGTLR